MRVIGHIYWIWQMWRIIGGSGKIDGRVIVACREALGMGCVHTPFERRGGLRIVQTEMVKANDEKF
jgi:hypothetical protein